MSHHVGHAVVKKATDLAILVELDTGKTKWIPKSVLGEENEVEDEGDSGELFVRSWFADKEDL